MAEGEAEAEGDASVVELVLELFLVVEDFFGEPDASALSLFLVVETFSVVADFFADVPDFLVVEAATVWCVVVALLEVAVVSFLLAQETNKASATTVIKESANLFIGFG